MKISPDAPIPDWSALETAFEHNAPDHHAYLDLSNGQVVTINDSRPEDEEKRQLISKSTGFDCSGYTKYVFAQLGISIPRVSRDQYAWSRHITRKQAVPGDLIFFHSASGRVYHAAIYAGNGYIWHSPHTGSRVKLERIWTSAYYVGRIR